MAAADQRILRVEGLRELQRAFAAADKSLGRGFREAVIAAGEPIKTEAERRIRSEISGMARSRVPWWSIRVGVEKGTVGYIVPAQRGRRGRSRKNLAPMLAVREEGARDSNASRVEQEFSDALSDLVKAWERY